MTLNILAITDEVDQRIYSSSIKQRMGDVQMVISCGDLPASYLEFLSDALNKPVYYVMGNHVEELTRAGECGVLRYPQGCIDLGGRVVTDPGSGLIMAGLPGSPRYSDHEPMQFSEWQMTWMIWKMTPRLLWNKFRHGRALDLLVTHAPPRDLNDREDRAHRGFVALRRFLARFHPAYQLHGHVHLYDRSKPNTTRFHETEIINVYPYQQLVLEFAHLPDPSDNTPDVSSPRSARAGAHNRTGLEVEHRA